MKTVTLFLSILLLAAVPARAEVTSKPCPYSCQSRGLDHSHCKDWKEGTTCFVDDMKPTSSVSSSGTSTELERKIVMVNKKIHAGETVEVDLKTNEVIDHIDTVVKREGGSTQTTLSASLGSGMNFGTKQIDKNENHVVQFAANGVSPDGRRLQLSASNGDVYVESVHVMLR